jgi:DNA-binding GntR family transcriptional regulator
MRGAVDRRSLPDYFSLSFAFYERICDLAGNAKLKEIYTELCCRMRLFRLQAHAREDRLSAAAIDLLETGIARRGSVINALATGDPRVAAKAMRDVAESALVRNREFYLRSLKGKPQRGGRAA